jgi:hypothetical protein
MFEPSVPKFVKGIEYKSMTVLLADFRKQLERESGGSINRLDVNGAELLSDLCKFLGLSDKNRQIVLGKDGARHVAMIESMPIMATIKH